jgi:hypothetical protein
VPTKHCLFGFNRTGFYLVAELLQYFCQYTVLYFKVSAQKLDIPMGLDSVELIFTVERYFNIHIPDTEAEKIGTVENLVDCISARIGASSDGAPASLAYQTMYDNVLNCLEQLIPQQLTVTAARPLRELIESTDWDAAIFRQQLEACLELEVPNLIYSRPIVRQSTLFRFFRNGSRQESQQVPTTFGDLIGWILAVNYKTVFAQPLLSYYDVQQATVGLINECSGMPVPDIQLTDSFMNDLGID